MIRHIVLIRFQPELTEADVSALFEELHRIEGNTPGLLSITSGRSESPEMMERGYVHGFVADFADWEALQTYQNNAEHQILGAKLIANAQGGKEGILCFDLPVTVDK